MFFCMDSKIHVHARFMLISHIEIARLFTDFYPNSSLTHAHKTSIFWLFQNVRPYYNELMHS